MKKSSDAEKQLKRSIGKFGPAHQTLIRAVRAALRKRFRTANELVYDNYNFFVIGYGPNDKAGDAIFSIAAQAKGVSLCFLQGAKLPDPKRVLRGSGNVVRNIRLEDDGTLDRPEVEALIAVALQRAKTPMPSEGKHQLIIKSVSAKQRPRRAA